MRLELHARPDVVVIGRKYLFKDSADTPRHEPQRLLVIAEMSTQQHSEVVETGGDIRDGLFAESSLPNIDRPLIVSGASLRSSHPDSAPT